MTNFDHFRPSRPRLVQILVFPDFQLLDAAGPITTFEEANREMPAAAYRLQIVSRIGGPVGSSSGVQVFAEPFADGPVETLIIAGGRGTIACSHCTETLSFIHAASAWARRMASVCTGALILGAAGLLDGRRVTTHWRHAAELARNYPQSRVEPDHIFIRDGKIWSSAGITAGIDLALAMVADDLGEDVAKRTAQQMVVYYRRPAGQSQFSVLLDLDRPSSRFSPLIEWARERLSERLGVERLAERAGMSTRNFTRVFAVETGMTPAKAVERLRFEVAREQVENGAGSIEQVAMHTGFGGAERMRRAFVRRFGQPPQSLRRTALLTRPHDR